MIAAETELLQHFNEDNFFGSRKKRKRRKARRKARRAARRNRPKVIIRREKRKKIVKDIGGVYRDLGGATGIGTIIDKVTSPEIQMENNPSDFEIALENPQTPEKKKPPIALYVVGGLTLAGIITLVIVKSKRKST